MNDEIKEILDFKENADYKKLSCDEIAILRDYIIDLQQENEKIRKMNMHEHKYGSDMEGKYLIEKTKNDRAVEYIKEHEYDIRNNFDCYVKGNELLDILNGKE